jgi:hypothetical protein
MSQITDQAESLRQQAITLLMAERQTIDEKLALLGADGTEAPVKKTKVCSVCGADAHNARTCPQKRGMSESASVPSV